MLIESGGYVPLWHWCAQFFHKEENNQFQYLIYGNLGMKTVNVYLMNNNGRHVKFVLCEMMIHYDKIFVKK